MNISKEFGGRVILYTLRAEKGPQAALLPKAAKWYMWYIEQFSHILNDLAPWVEPLTTSIIHGWRASTSVCCPNACGFHG